MTYQLEFLSLLEFPSILYLVNVYFYHYQRKTIIGLCSELITTTLLNEHNSIICPFINLPSEHLSLFLHISVAFKPQQRLLFSLGDG